MRKQYLIVAAFLLLMAACTAKEIPVFDTVPESVRFQVHSLPVVEEAGSTRVSLVHSGNVQSFRWEAADTVGIFPDTGSQVWFCMSTGAGTNFSA